MTDAKTLIESLLTEAGRSTATITQSGNSDYPFRLTGPDGEVVDDFESHSDAMKQCRAEGWACDGSVGPRIPPDVGGGDDPEGSMEGVVSEALAELGYRVASFSDAGIMTRNHGVVATGELGKFQITIVHDKR